MGTFNGMYSDAFDGVTINPEWTVDISGGGVAAGGGVLTCSPTASHIGYCGVSSNDTFDITGTYTIVAVPQVLNNHAGAQTIFALNYDANNNFKIVHENGTLSFEYTLAGTTTIVGSTGYFLNTMRYWGIQELNGTINFVTAYNGRNFTVRASVANPLSTNQTQNMGYQLAAGTNVNTIAVPGTATFNALNIADLSAAYLFADNFSGVGYDGATIDPTLWTVNPTNGPVTINSNLQLQIAPTALSTGYSNIYSNPIFDITGNFFMVGVTQVTTQGAPGLGAETQFQMTSTIDPEQYFEILVGYDGLLTFRYHLTAGDVYSDTTIAYDPYVHKYWLIRETGGIITFETSPNGRSFTVQRSVSNPLSMNDTQNMVVTLAAGCNSNTTTTPGIACFDNVNIPAEAGS